MALAHSQWLYASHTLHYKRKKKKSVCYSFRRVLTCQVYSTILFKKTRSLSLGRHDFPKTVLMISKESSRVSLMRVIHVASQGLQKKSQRTLWLYWQPTGQALYRPPGWLSYMYLVRRKKGIIVYRKEKGKAKIFNKTAFSSRCFLSYRGRRWQLTVWRRRSCCATRRDSNNTRTYDNVKHKATAAMRGQPRKVDFRRTYKWRRGTRRQI